MKILAFLQNQWFKNPDRARRALAAAEADGYRDAWPRRLLFAGCITGRRLKSALGEDLCRQIIWENASPQIAGKASECFKPDPAHMLAAIRKHRPQIILLFGKVAQQGWFEVIDHPTPPATPADQVIIPAANILHAPHPAARGKGVIERLLLLGSEIRQRIELDSRTAPGTADLPIGRQVPA